MPEHDCIKCGTGYFTCEGVPLPFICNKCHSGDLPPAPADPLTEIMKVVDMQAETMKNLMEVMAALEGVVAKLVKL